jgi:hypothetical protein
VTGERNVTSGPFKNTIAFITIKNELPEIGMALKLKQAYGSSFQTVFVDVPSGKQSNSVDYMPVYSIVKLIANSASFSKIDGIFYFQSDSWINTPRFEKADFTKIWTLGRGRCRRPNSESAWVSREVVDTDKEKELIEANKEAVYIAPYLNIDEHSLCSGQPDMYFLPRKYFGDFLYLASTYGDRQTPVDPALALPTIWNIIERYHSPHRSGQYFRNEPVILPDLLNCRNMSSSMDDMLQAKCGHSVDLSEERSRRMYFNSLNEINRRFAMLEVDILS